MKFTAIFMIVCLTFLSSLLGIVNAMPKVNDNCCQKTTHTKSCEHPKSGQDRGCEKGTCNMMLSCSTCGFLIVDPLKISATITYVAVNNTHFGTVDKLSSYANSCWQPPKI
jgi:hypothetical protein